MTIPTIIFQGKLDRSIDLMSSVIVLEGIGSTEKELIWMEESTHCILIDRQLPEAEMACLEFIRAHQ
jgi:carboxylesterase